VEPVDLADYVDSRRDHIGGTLDPPVTLVSYGDFSSPYCRQAESEEMHDMLLAHEHQLRPVDLVRYAEDLGLDTEPVREALRRHAYAERIAGDVATAEVSGATGMARFFVNASRQEGAYDFDTVASVVRGAGARVR
jgi:protein-disulfide isomerase